MKKYDEIIAFCESAKNGGTVLRRKKSSKRNNAWEVVEKATEFNFDKYDYKVGSSQWRQVKGLNYYSITEAFSVTKNVENNSVEDNIKWKAKNYFKTSADAYKVIEKITAELNGTDVASKKKETKKSRGKMTFEWYKNRYHKAFELIAEGRKHKDICSECGLSTFTISKLKRMARSVKNA